MVSLTHAADAMTTQGRRPRLVRWNWQRDVTHRFLYREQRMRFFADGADRFVYSHATEREQHAGPVVWPVPPLQRNWMMNG